MRGIVKRKGQTQLVSASRRTIKVLITSLFLSVIFLAFYNPVHAKAEEMNDVSSVRYEKPTVKTDTEYNTEHNPSVKLPATYEEDSTMEWEIRDDNDNVVQGFSEYQTVEPVRGKEIEDKFKLPVSIDLNKQYKGMNQYYKELSQYCKEFGTKLRLERTAFIRTTTFQFLALKDFIAQNKAPKIPVAAFPVPDVNTQGNLIASEKITVRVKISRGSQFIKNNVINNSRTTSDQEHAVFCAAQKLNRWIKRKQTLF